MAGQYQGSAPVNLRHEGVGAREPSKTSTRGARVAFSVDAGHTLAAVWPALLLLAAGLALLVGLRRANELCVVDLRRGKARLVRGRIPPRLLSDLGDIARASGSAGARVRVVVASARPEVLVHGTLDAASAQRVRNVVGLYGLAQMRAGRRR